jgi:hypothetical protein
VAPAPPRRNREHDGAEDAGSDAGVDDLPEMVLGRGLLATARVRCVLEEVRAPRRRVGHPRRVPGHEALPRGRAHAPREESAHTDRDERDADEPRALVDDDTREWTES